MTKTESRVGGVSSRTGSQPGMILLPVGQRQCLEIFLTVTTGWPLVGRALGLGQTSSNAGYSLHSKELSGQNVNSCRG